MLSVGKTRNFERRLGLALLHSFIYYNERVKFPPCEKLRPGKFSLRETLAFFGLASSSLAVGSQISTIAVAWQVYEITNSPFQLGLTGLFRALPVMIFSIPGGVVADRMDRRWLLIITQSLAAVLALILGLLTSTGRGAGLAYLRRHLLIRSGWHF